MEELFTTPVKIDDVKVGDEICVAPGKRLKVAVFDVKHEACEGTWHKVTKTAFEDGRRVFYVENHKSTIGYFLPVVFDAARRARRKEDLHIFVAKPRKRSPISPFESVAALNKDECSKCNGTGNMGMISSVRCTCSPS